MTKVSPLIAILCTFWVMAVGPTRAVGQATDHGDIRGKVIDAVDGAPIEGAEVSAGGRNALTNGEGEFALLRVPTGPQRLRAVAFGYRADSLTVAVPESERVTLELTPTALSIEGLQVTVVDDIAVRRVNGSVRDAATGVPLSGARLEFPYADLEDWAVSDEQGHFQLEEVPAKPVLLRASRLGYRSKIVQLSADADDTKVKLEPDSAVLKKLRLIEGRVRSSRRAIATMRARAIGAADIERSGLTDPWDILRSLGNVIEVPCTSGDSMDVCIRKRGVVRRMRVCVDGFVTMGGLEHLRSYRARDLHLIEVLGGGLYVRAYTVGFMEREAAGSGGWTECPHPDRLIR